MKYEEATRLLLLSSDMKIQEIALYISKKRSYFQKDRLYVFELYLKIHRPRELGCTRST